MLGLFLLKIFNFFYLCEKIISMIAEIFLYSSGFEKARILAKKVVTCLKLSSEQLSSQSHYDFGMRALKAILNGAREFKKESPSVIEEENLILRALLDINITKFTQNDIPLFSNIVSDLFPGKTFPKRDHSKLIFELENSCKLNFWNPKEEFIYKCLQLLDTLITRHGVMILGEALSGKSTIIQCLKEAISNLCNNNSEEFLKKTKVNYLNKIITKIKYLIFNSYLLIN